MVLFRNMNSIFASPKIILRKFSSVCKTAPTAYVISTQQAQQQQQQQCDRRLSTASNTDTSTRRQYRFTRDDTSDVLTTEQRDFYEQNGYLIIEGMISADDIRRWIDRFDEYASGKRKPSGALLLQKELAAARESIAANTLYKIGELYEDETLFEYCANQRILDHVQCFTGPNIMAIHTMLINKPPDAGTKSSRHPLHQDLHYFPMRPADSIVCAWTAMERITRENGCLVACPGTHRGAHLEHAYPDWSGGVNALYYGIQDMSAVRESRVHLTMNTGDTVLFHPLLVHGSGMNRTAGFRKAISCHYAAAECDFIDVRGTIQQALAEETLAIVGKRLSAGVELDYAQMWKLRARLVRGAGGYEW